MSGDIVKSSVKLPVFDGQEKHFSNWITKYKAYARFNGFSELLVEEKPHALGARENDPSHQDGSQNAEALRLFRLNSLAVANLTYAFTNDNHACLGFVQDGMTTEWPNGAAWLIMKRLYKRYKPSDLMTEVELNRRLGAVKLAAKESPGSIFTQLAAIRTWYSKEIPEEKILPAIIQALPKDYKLVATQYSLMKSRQLTTDTLEDLEEMLIALWRSLGGTHGSSEDGDTAGEMGLGSFEGTCYKCKGKGHKANACPQQTNKFQGKCNLCGRNGHKKADCYEDEANASKRPKNWKSKLNKSGTEAGNVQVDAGNVEFQFLCGVCQDEGLLVNNRDMLIVEVSDENWDEVSADGNAFVYQAVYDNGLSIKMSDDVFESQFTGLDSTDHGLSIEMSDDVFECQFTGVNISVPDDINILDGPDIWLADSGATVHSTPHDAGFVDLQPLQASDKVKVGSGEVLAAGKIGNIKGLICDKHGTVLSDAKLSTVMHIPTSKYNLLSLTLFMKNGWKMYGDADQIELRKGTASFVFDIKITTNRGVLYGLYFKRSSYETMNLNIDTVHKLLGHSNEADSRASAQSLGLSLTRGGMSPCLACTLAKAKQRNIKGTSVKVKHSSLKKSEGHVRASKEALRLYVDLAWFKQPEKGPQLNQRYWRMMADERTQLKFTDFYSTKDGMVNPTVEMISSLIKDGHKIKFIRCDNGGENKLLQTMCNGVDWKLNLSFEFTARDTPQQNWLVEKGFAVILGKARALMADANVSDPMRFVLYRSAIITATMLDGLVVESLNGVSATRYVHFFGTNPKWSAHLRTWGEAGTVKVATDTSSKLANKGVQRMFVGYPKNHAGDVYTMYDPVTNRAHVTRDIIWLKRMYYEKLNKPEVHGDGVLTLVTKCPKETADRVVHDDEGDDDDPSFYFSEQGGNVEQGGPVDQGGLVSTTPSASDETFANNPFQLLMDDDSEEEEKEEEDEITPKASTAGNLVRFAPTVTRSGRQVRAPKRLIEEMSMEEFDKIIQEFTLVGAGIGGGFDHTSELTVMNYKQAMKSPDKDKWKQAVREEYHRMVQKKVWRRVKAVNIPTNAKILSSTWAMKKKSNGVHRARLVARGYEQEQGEHYVAESISSPTVNDVTIRIVFVLLLLGLMVGWVIDVNGAFLLGLFEDGEKLYLRIPEGFEEFCSPDEVLELDRTIYGLKQAAKAFWRQLLQCVEDIGFKRSEADPCLYIKKDSRYGLILIVSWIDDLLIVGSVEAVQDTRTQIQERFDCEDIGALQEYIGCKIDVDRKKRRLKVTQPVLIQSFLDEFDLPDLDNLPFTPAEPGQVLVKCDEQHELSAKMKTVYRSGVGKLLYMMRWSRPDILNSVRELSKFMHNPGPAHLTAMYRVMGYILNTKHKGLTLAPQGGLKEIEISGTSDSNYATDPDNRKSVSGYAVFVNKAAVSYKSVQQKVVTLSSTEAELYAIVQCAQEMLFVMNVIESIGLVVTKPMSLFCDNKGAILLTNNWSVGGRTRHIEVRQYFLRDLKEMKVLLCQWKSGKDISTDMFTKNLDRNTFELHLPVYVQE